MLSVACQVLKKGKKFKVPVNNIYLKNFACFFFLKRIPNGEKETRNREIFQLLICFNSCEFQRSK